MWQFSISLMRSFFKETKTLHSSYCFTVFNTKRLSHRRERQDGGDFCFIFTITGRHCSCSFSWGKQPCRPGRSSERSELWRPRSPSGTRGREGGHRAGRWAPRSVGRGLSALSRGCDSGRCLGRESGAELCFLREGPPLPAWRQLPGRHWVGGLELPDRRGLQRCKSHEPWGSLHHPGRRPGDTQAMRGVPRGV